MSAPSHVFRRLPMVYGLRPEASVDRWVGSYARTRRFFRSWWTWAVELHHVCSWGHVIIRTSIAAQRPVSTLEGSLRSLTVRLLSDAELRSSGTKWQGGRTTPLIVVVDGRPSTFLSVSRPRGLVAAREHHDLEIAIMARGHSRDVMFDLISYKDLESYGNPPLGGSRSPW